MFQVDGLHTLLLSLVYLFIYFLRIFCQPVTYMCIVYFNTIVFRLAEHDMLVEQIPPEFRGLIPHEPEPVFKYSSEEENSM